MIQGDKGGVSMKTTKIILEADGVEPIEVNIDHAERILNLADSCWRLPQDSKFIYNRDNGKIEPKSTKRAAETATE